MDASSIGVSQEPLPIRADEVEAAEVGLSTSPTMDIADTGVEGGQISTDQSADGINRREISTPSILLPARPSLSRNQSQPPPPQQPPPPPAPQAQQSLSDQNESLSLSQLKQIVTQMPRFERTAYAFIYTDTASVPEELDEWFSYSEEEQARLTRARSTFEIHWNDFVPRRSPERSKPPDWTSAPVSQRNKFLRMELEGLENPDIKTRSPSLQAILYVLLGVWGETAGLSNSDDSGTRSSDGTETGNDEKDYRSSSTQTRWMLQGAESIHHAMGIQTLFDVLRSACLREWEDKSEPPELTPDHVEATECETQELTNALTAMYLLVEAVELIILQVSLEPNYLLFLVKIVARLRWDDTTDLPLMKILLLLWKSLLLFFGGAEQLHTIKATTQAQSSPTTDHSSEMLIRASPLDYHLFRQEITSKYPAYNPPPPLIPLELENNSILPPLANYPSRYESNGLSAGITSTNVNGNGGSILHQPVHIATPAPSPPPSPIGPGGKAGKKQNYQTNQNFPFLYPPLDSSSNSAGGKGTAGLQDMLVGKKWEGSDIPASILEAGELFAGRMRMTRSIKQLWEERENYMKFERGWGKLNNGLDRLDSDPDDQPTSPDTGNRDETNAVNGLDEDTKRRLDLIEEFYRNALPHLQSLVIVLLKVVLQNVTSLITQLSHGSGPQNPLAPGFQPQDSNVPNGVPRGKGKEANGRFANGLSHDQNDDGANAASGFAEDVDDIRSREIIAKAVSGLLLLLLKWFKVSHILKFEYLTQLLLDSNYLPLILKLFAHQDLDKVVDSKPDKEGLNFFAFCQSHEMERSRDGEEIEASDDDACPPPVVKYRRDESISVQAGHTTTASSSAVMGRPPEVDELGYPTNELPSEPITTFSWRNFFSSINFLRIMQKICKHKAHRNLLLVQYKSSTILKKSLKVPQPDLRLYTLKLFKNQVPYCGRKWRQSNMRVITAVYLHCRPELRDDWLAGSDVDAEVEEALPLEQALRALTHWHNLKRYPEQMGAETGVLEEEQDFFVRELEKMDYGDESSAAEEGDGDRVWEGPLHMEGW
ncbi:MAG: Factor arrest protein 11 [Sclerophora amabilis]|nr:MAG: Factor arrest protein 11 [Sclerophora amabilis]